MATNQSGKVDKTWQKKVVRTPCVSTMTSTNKHRTIDTRGLTRDIMCLELNIFTFCMIIESGKYIIFCQFLYARFNNILKFQNKLKQCLLRRTECFTLKLSISINSTSVSFNAFDYAQEESSLGACRLGVRCIQAHTAS